MISDIVNGIFAVTHFYKKANERKYIAKNQANNEIGQKEEEKNVDNEEDNDDKIKYLPLDFLVDIANENILTESIPDFSFEKVGKLYLDILSDNNFLSILL